MHMLRQGCSLHMLLKICEKLYGYVRLGALSMPSTFCSSFILSPGVLRRTLSQEKRIYLH